jgi:hypothetical protein
MGNEKREMRKGEGGYLSGPSQAQQSEEHDAHLKGQVMFWPWPMAIYVREGSREEDK